MPTLADTLSALLAQATRARVAADRETARIALLYQQDELLRTMPVPRFRLPTLTVDMPVAVVGLADPAAATVEVLPLDLVERWRTQAVDRVESELAVLRYTLIDREQLPTALAREADRWRLGGAAVPAVEVDRAVIEALSAWPVSAESVEPPIPVDDLPDLRARLREAVLAVTRPMLVTEPAPPPPTPPPGDVQVEIGTAALRELGAGAPFTTLRLQIAEEGVEVTHVEQAGATTRRLTPE